jgi:hypothetical protein
MAAKWNAELEVTLITLYREAAANPRLVAAGGKNLKAAGWQTVLPKLMHLEPSIKTKAQIETKWKRLKADYSDYAHLVGLSGFGAGFDDAKWSELDQGRTGTITYNRTTQ